VPSTVATDLYRKPRPRWRLQEWMVSDRERLRTGGRGPELRRAGACELDHRGLSDRSGFGRSSGCCLRGRIGRRVTFARRRNWGHIQCGNERLDAGSAACDYDSDANSPIGYPADGNDPIAPCSAGNVSNESFPSCVRSRAGNRDHGRRTHPRVSFSRVSRDKP